MYVVDRRLAAPDGLTSVTAEDVTARITINDASGAAKTTSAVYALLSFGANGHGAYPRAGGATRLSNYTVPVAPDAGDELLNCKCTNVAAAAGAVAASLVQKPAALGVFDDVVFYGTRADFVLRQQN
jgi:hypothetical protein